MRAKNLAEPSLSFEGTIVWLSVIGIGPSSHPGRGNSIVRAIARMRPLAQVLPAALFDVDAVVLGRLLDVGKGELALRIRDVLDLVEARQRVAYVRRVGQRLFTLLGEGVHVVWQRLAIGGIQLTMFRARFPCCSMRHAWLKGQTTCQRHLRVRRPGTG